MSRLNVGSFRHPDATADAITLTNGGDIQINRALGLGGATYGTSGQVLTSAGSASAPTWEDLPSSGLTWLTSTEVNGTGTVTVTGIPTTAQYIKIVVSRVSVTTTAAYHMLLRFGNGSLVSTNNYKWAVSYGGNAYYSTSDNRIQLLSTAFSGQGSIYDGTFEMTRVGGDGNWWSGSWVMGDPDGQNPTNVGGCFYNGTAAIDRVQFFPNSNTYDSGYIRVGYA